MNENAYNTDGIGIINIETVFDLLSLIEKNPKVYLGGVTNSDSYAALVAYLNGLEHSHLFDSEKYSLRDFKKWAHEKYVPDSADDFYGWVDKKYGHERAFPEFFRVLNEYRLKKGV